MKNKLQIIFLGGVGEIGKNMTALRYANDIIVLDAGLSFPTEEMPGIDVVVPDLTYLKDNARLLRGIVLTHGHEDHIGGLPYLLKEIKAPVYGTKLALMLAENKLKEHRVQDARLSTVMAGMKTRLGCFEVEYISVSHSIAGSVSLSITTPVGVVFFTGDFKIDHTPVGTDRTDLPRIAEIGSAGVHLLMCDSTNIEREGVTMSERTVGHTVDELMAANVGRRLIIATFASNVHRIQQIIDISKKYNRKVAFSGRSMINIADAAAKIGELKIDKNQIVDIDRINKIEDKHLTILSTGSQGEPMSALSRMAAGEFNKVTVGGNDTIIISASPIPGNERMIYRVINNLYQKGARVIYDMLERVHVSGHACKEELKLIHALVRPRYFIPVHGEYRHLVQHKELAMAMGMPEHHILIPEIGCVAETDKSSLRRIENVKAGSRLIDGLGLEDVSGYAMQDRRRISEEGLLVVVIGINEESGQVTSGPDIISRGFVNKETDNITDSIRACVLTALGKMDLKATPKGDIASAVRREVKNFIFRKVRTSPMIMPIIV